MLKIKVNFVLFYSIKINKIVLAAKKPFISTVRSGERIPPLMESGTNIRCTKCNSQSTRSLAGHDVNVGVDKMPSVKLQNEIDRLEDRVKNLTDQLEFYKRKVYNCFQLNLYIFTLMYNVVFCVNT